MYSPGNVPFDDKSVRAFLSGELSSVSEAMQRSEDGVAIPVRAVPPKKVQRGMLAIADGTNWNPGRGFGLYIWDGSQWKACF